jgi:hypothetical protein
VAAAAVVGLGIAGAAGVFLLRRRSRAIFPLAVNRPQEALEVFLAVLIQHPMRHGWSEDPFSRQSFGLDDNHNCRPPFYHQGPFLALLRCGDSPTSFALSLIIRVTNFATERWLEHYLQLTTRYPDIGAEGPSSVMVPSSTAWWGSQPNGLLSAGRCGGRSSGDSIPRDFGRGNACRD